MFLKLLPVAMLATALFALAAPANATGAGVCVANGSIFDCTPVGDLENCVLGTGTFEVTSPAAASVTWCV
jgi:hypothetical protein